MKWFKRKNKLKKIKHLKYRLNPCRKWKFDYWLFPPVKYNPTFDHIYSMVNMYIKSHVDDIPIEHWVFDKKRPQFKLSLYIETQLHEKFGK